jgi:hypothetical protein
METMSRKKLVGLGLAGATGTLIASSPRASHATDTLPASTLDVDYEYPGPPTVRVSYPSAWTLVGAPVENLLTPSQLFAISSYSLVPAASDDEDWSPDVDVLPSHASLIYLVHDTFQVGDEYDVGLSSVTTIAYHDLVLRDDGSSDVAWRFQVLETPSSSTERNVYSLSVWSGAESPHEATVREIVGSIVFG